MLSDLGRPALAARRILIVEDRYLVADDLRRICRGLGGEVAGLAANVEQARRMAADDTLDLAILDIDLRGQDVFEVAAILEERGTPFVFVTGYRRGHLPERYRSRPLVAKPFSREDLLAGIEALALAPPGARRQV